MRDMSTFTSEEQYEAFLKRGKEYFRSKFHMGNLYMNPRSSLPMLLHIWEQNLETNKLLAEIADLLKSDEKKTSEVS